MGEAVTGVPAKADARKNGTWIAVITSVILVALVAVVIFVTINSPQHDNPFESKALYIYSQSSAAKAAAHDASGTPAAAASTTIASEPAAIWLLPEQHPTAEITEFVSMIEADAAAKSQLPVFVIYGIPSRDCGNFSAGGTDSAEYPVWVSAIAAGIGSRPTVVILEPDAVALSPACKTQDATASLLNAAIDRLTVNTSTTIYLDGGHSNWLSPEVMAPLLRAAGVAKIRGFATNVSNFNATGDEVDYGDRLSALLGGAHYVIDTSRNGSGSTGAWCNPPDRTLGDTPSGVALPGPHDANLWIKNPGESDGECNGGPPAGSWWPEQALELTRDGL